MKIVFIDCPEPGIAGSKSRFSKNKNHASQKKLCRKTALIEKVVGSVANGAGSKGLFHKNNKK